MRCEHCGFDNQANAEHCEQCSAVLVTTCPSCKHTLRPGARFCDSCGTRLEAVPEKETGPLDTPIQYTPAHLAERILAEQARLLPRVVAAGERKIVTALFADMAGSTALVAELDPEDARRLIDPVLALMMEAVHHYEGYVAKSLGDGILALFGAPIGHEDHPQRALYAALRMQQAMRRYADGVRREQGIGLQIRVGVNTGEVVVRAVRTEDLHVDYDPVGPSIHLASRMETIAAPGSIVVSEATYRLVQGYFEFRELGATAVKGLSAPVNAYEVLGNGPLRTRLQVAARRGLACFVGRQEELAALERALRRVQDGHGQVVGVMGEPGVGKSRLFLEFKQRVQTCCRLLETFSVSHGKAFAYMPLIELLKQYLQISPQDDEAQRRRKLSDRLGTLDAALQDSLPYLCYLLGMAEADSALAQMDAQLRRQRTREAIRRWLVRESLNQPLVLIFEDLQWLDSETEGFLNYLIEGLDGAAILLLLNYRPEYRHHWDRRDDFSLVHLQPLAQPEAEALLETLLGRDASLAPLKPRIWAQAQGNPFFIEEIVQTLAEQGVLGGRVGHYRLERELGSLHIPTTVQGVLCARMDRLGAADKSLLQTLAVIGKEFPWSLVRQVVALPENELRRGLVRLQAGEFLYEQPAFPEVEYIFKHALTQEVAYNSLLREQRGALHGQIGRAIESLFEGHLEEHCKELAHHYSRSGNIDKAVEYLHRAGQQAMRQASVPEAIQHFNFALKLLQSLPDSSDRDRLEFGIRLDLGPALIAVQGYAAPAVGETYSLALELKRGAGTEQQLFPVLLGLRNYHHVRGQMRSGRDYAECLLSLAQRAEDPALLMEAHRAMGSSCFNQGDLRAARKHFEQVVAGYHRREHQAHLFRYGLDPGVFALGYLGWVLSLQGEPEQARERAEEALGLAQQLNIPYVLTYALVLCAEVDVQQRNAAKACERAGAAVALADEYGYPFWGSWAQVLLGAGLSLQGNVDEGVIRLQQGLAGFWATGAELWCTHFLALLAEAQAAAGRTDKALEVLAQARDSLAATGERAYQCELQRLEGELMLMRSGTTAVDADDALVAQACFERAVEAAHRQGAISLELRAALSRSRLWLQQGRTQEARAALARLCESYGEGSDSDLQAALDLLAQLN
ncbi:adenylate/guanylate cyclase domain-containing protein [Marinobacterium rhizophilum]|uniref:adenylate/guanylate cyclase domain-containing protein n=1 Tax=Marinobacterium rhizophilum TaxID=420402 RepID=UPI00035D0090|nr:adenylate/guanylate cyclase domain-containing protein [Marinobacterium rhizophilum]